VAGAVGVGSADVSTTSDRLRRYAVFSPVARREYRACMAEEGELLRRHGYALAPPMPFELVAAWLDAGAPASAEAAPLALAADLFTTALGAALARQEAATGGELTVESILAGEAPGGEPLAPWVETTLGELGARDERLTELSARVRVRILLAVAYEAITADGPFAGLDALRDGVVARVQREDPDEAV
jgi:hypothetical protein